MSAWRRESSSATVSTLSSADFAGSAKLQQGMAADSIDIGIGSGPELAFVAKGAPVLGVAAMAGPPLLLAVVVKKDGPIHGVADLKGKTMSTSTVGSLTTWLVRELSRQQGWGPEGIKIVHLGGDAPQIAALRTGETVGAPLDIATIYRLEEQGVGRLLYRFGDLVKDFHIHVIYATNKIIDQNLRRCGNSSPAGSTPSLSCARTRRRRCASRHR